MKAMVRRLWCEGRDLLELVLIPGLAAVLPWTFCFRIFRRLARWQWLYREACEADWRQAHAKGFAQDRLHWLWERKLVQLVDHADHYLHRTRSDAWMRRHLQVRGDWMEHGRPSFLFTFHWGAGMWGLRHARKAGLSVHALSAPAENASFHGRWVLMRYVKARLRSVEQALEQPLVFVPRGLRQVKDALARDEQILALLDVPQDGSGKGQVFGLLGEQVLLSMAIPEMAARQSQAYAVYATGLDVASGQRFLEIMCFGPGAGAQDMTLEMLAQLEALIWKSPAAWHLWGQWPRFCARQ